jgi:hypothetical protein
MGATGIYTININVDGGSTCEGSGMIYREIWNGIPGTSVSTVPFDTSPDQVIELTKFETANYFGNDYGSRIRGYLCVPVNGAFTFFLASDDNSELWLSTDENPENKVLIAYLNSAVPPGDYLRYASQRSAAVHLAGGSRYYIEALHKEGNGADHISVAWRFPNGFTEAPIPGTRLIPYSDPSATAATINTSSPYSTEGGENTISIYPNPVIGGEELSISIGETIEGHDVQVEIISGTGNVLPLETVKHTGNGELRIPVNRSVASGIYLVRVFNNKKRWTKKLQIK